MDERLPMGEVQTAESEKASAKVANNLFGRLGGFLKNYWQVPAAAALLVSIAPGCDKNRESEATNNTSGNIETTSPANAESQTPEKHQEREKTAPAIENDSEIFAKPIAEELKEIAKDILAVEKLRIKEHNLILGTVLRSGNYVVADVGSTPNTDVEYTVLFKISAGGDPERVGEIDVYKIDDPRTCYDQKPKDLSEQEWQKLFEFPIGGGEE